MLLERKRADIAKAEEVGIRLENFPKFHCRAELMNISFFLVEKGMYIHILQGHNSATLRGVKTHFS